MQSIRIAVLALALCFGASLLPVQSHAAAPLPKVKIETSMGDIVVELNPAKAPKTVSNFLYYVKSGFYNNTIFHRVINGFMIQGGGHTADMQEKANSRKPVVNEAGNGLKNDAYTIAMARTNDPDSATAQFFINAQMWVACFVIHGSCRQFGYVALIVLQDFVDSVHVAGNSRRNYRVGK